MFSPEPTFGSASLGREFLMNDAGDITATGSLFSFLSSSSHSSTPPPTTVSTLGSNLEFRLIWDSSVAGAPTGFRKAIVDAARYYTELFTGPTKEVLRIDVGYGEIDGSALAPDALGESESYGYITNGATSALVVNALDQDTYAPTTTASNALAGSQLWVNTAEAKALGLANPTSGRDGYIAFANLGSGGWNTAAAVGPTGGPGAGYDLQAVAAHEISEVMGRIGIEGTVSENGEPLYTPLDGFNYSSPGVLSRSTPIPNDGGYFSINGGINSLGVYNDNYAYTGDIADWASYGNAQSETLGLPAGYYDSYDAFSGSTAPGYVSEADIVEDAALGYELTSTGACLMEGAV